MSILLHFLAFAAFAQITDASVFKGRAGVSAINRGVPVIKDTIAPKLIKFINDGIADAGFSSQRIGFNFPSAQLSFVHGSIEAKVGRISVADKSERVSVGAGTGDNDQSARISSMMEDLSLDLGGFTLATVMKLNGANEIPVDCGVSVSIASKIPQTGFGVFTEIDANSNKASVQVENVNLSFPEFQVGLPRVSGSCVSNRLVRDFVDDFIANPLTSVINTFFTTLSREISNVLTNAANLFAGFIGRLSFPLLPPLQLSVLPGRSLEVFPALTAFRAGGFPDTFLESAGDLALTAALSKPTHRAGSSLSNTAREVKDIPDPNTDQLINLHLSAEGLNNIVEPAWYLMWSTLATDPSALKSSLCEGQAVATDQCPFPPFIKKADFFAGILMTVAGLFIVGPMTGWRYEVIARPPRVDFEGGQAITGKASAVVALAARGLLTGVEQEVFKLDASVDLSALIPNYDSATGFFSGLGLNRLSLQIGEFGLQTPLGFLGEWAMKGPITGALNAVLNTGLPLVNMVINDALGGIPFKIPDIPIDPLDFTLRSEFEGAFAESVAADGEIGSFLRFGSNVVISSIENQKDANVASGEPLIGSINRSPLFNTAGYQMAASGEYDTATTFSTMISNAEGEDDTFILRRTESGSIERLVGDEWVTIEFDK